MKNRALLIPTLLIACYAQLPATEALIEKADQPPRPIKREKPEFPDEMINGGLSGNVMLDFLVTPTGGVEDIQILASNNPWFNRPAIDALLKWRFEPGRKEGRPAKVRSRQEFIFLHARSKRSGLWILEKGKGHKSLPVEFQWDTAPIAISSNFPVYPFAELLAKVRGKTKARIIISPDGRVIVAEAMEASIPELGRAAAAAMETWFFTPPKKKDGTACFAVVDMDHEFIPSGRGNVPLTAASKKILELLEKSPTDILTIRNLDAPPTPVLQGPPIFPSALRDKEMSGEAEIEFFIDENGDAQLPRIVSATAPEFGYAAAQAVAAWRFSPPMINGKPAVVRMKTPVGFSLQ